MMKSDEDVKIYFVTIPAHKFMHIKIMKAMGTGISGRSKA